MLKLLGWILLVVAQPSFAQTWSYDFSGTLSAHFEHIDGDPSRSIVAQTGGRLTFQTLGTPDSSREVFLFEDAELATSHSWNASLDVAVPRNLSLQSPTVPGEAWAAASLFAFVNDSYGRLEKMVKLDLQANNPLGPIFRARAYDFQNEISLAVAVRATNLSAGMLMLSFDAASQALSVRATNTWAPMLVLDTGDWGLDESDRFRIAMGFETQLLPVPQGLSLSMDNFRVTAVPEPAASAMLIAGVGLVALVVRRRERSSTVAARMSASDPELASQPHPADVGVSSERASMLKEPNGDVL